MLQTKTDVIDAIYHNNERSEIRLKQGKIYTGNIRLGNLGCTITNPAQEFMYNSTSGVYSLIQEIYLYDGTTQLDVLRDAHHMFGFRNIQQSGMKMNKNAFNFNVNQQLCGLNNSFDVERDPQDTSARPLLVDVINNEDYFASNDSATTFKGWMNLQNHFPFLQQMVYDLGGEGMQLLDTSVFRDFRIIIVWRSSAELLSCFQGITAGLSANILQPQVYVDEVLNPLKLPQSLNFQYMSYVLDKVFCDGQAGGAGPIAVTNVRRCNAFNNKYVNKLLIMSVDIADLTNADANGVNGIKCDGSKIKSAESFQITVNGDTLFNFGGVDNPSRKLHFLLDSWGNVNIPLLSYLDPAVANQIGCSQQVLNLSGKMSYLGCLIQKKVAELNVQYSRTAPQNDAGVYLYVWGELVNQMQIQNGQYAISSL